MATFFIAPFQPVNDPSLWDDLMGASDLRIDPNLYRSQLTKRWPLVKFFDPSDAEILLWSFYELREGKALPRGIGAIQSNHQIATFDSPYIDFFLWHRTVIPSSYRLFLFSDISWDSLELKSDTTREDIAQFVGGRSR